MPDPYEDFDNRLRRIERDHLAMRRGTVAHMGRDGLITFRAQRRVSRGFSLRGVLMLALGMVIFKALAISNLGTTGFQARVDRIMAEGSLMERTAATMLQPDPVTSGLAKVLDEVFSTLAPSHRL